MYTIKRYNGHTTIVEQWLTTANEFATATNQAAKFPTIAHAVNNWHQVHTRFHKPQVWIEGPKGGRYDPMTGKQIR